MAECYLTRREVFSAAHYLRCEDLSEEENIALFGKCCNLNGHGHNYELFVTLKGEPDPKTGLIINLVDLKHIILDTVIDRVDHKNLNKEVDEFKSLNPSVENIAIVIWKWLIDVLPENLLYEVKVVETENNIALYRGE